MSSEIERLVGIVARLRQPDGCPWDRVQTHDSIKKNLVEECGEFLDALEDRDLEEMREEIGDILLQVVFHCQIGHENGEFDLEGVAREVSDKLIRRHPHVFGETKAATPEEALKSWESSKVGEPGAQSRRASVLDGVPRSVPGLSRMQKTLAKAAKQGFAYPDEALALAKIHEELAEVESAIANHVSEEVVNEEIGDLLTTVVALCRHRQCEAEELMHAAVKKFTRRFQGMEGLAEKPLKELSSDEWLALWEKSKNSDVK